MLGTRRTQGCFVLGSLSDGLGHGETKRKGRKREKTMLVGTMFLWGGRFPTDRYDSHRSEGPKHWPGSGNPHSICSKEAHPTLFLVLFFHCFFIVIIIIINIIFPSHSIVPDVWESQFRTRAIAHWIGCLPCVQGSIPGPYMVLQPC